MAAETSYDVLLAEVSVFTHPYPLNPFFFSEHFKSTISSLTIMMR